MVSVKKEILFISKNESKPSSRVEKYYDWDKEFTGDIQHQINRTKYQWTWKMVNWDYSVWGTEYFKSVEKWVDSQRLVSHSFSV